MAMTMPVTVALPNLDIDPSRDLGHLSQPNPDKLGPTSLALTLAIWEP